VLWFLVLRLNTTMATVTSGDHARLQQCTMPTVHRFSLFLFLVNSKVNLYFGSYCRNILNVHMVNYFALAFTCDPVHNQNFYTLCIAKQKNVGIIGLATLKGQCFRNLPSNLQFRVHLCTIKRCKTSSQSTKQTETLPKQLPSYVSRISFFVAPVLMVPDQH
jgi:hypothetical protein